MTDCRLRKATNQKEGSEPTIANCLVFLRVSVFKTPRVITHGVSLNSYRERMPS